MFFQTLAHGNSKNEIRQRDRRKRLEERREYGKKYNGHERREVPTAYHYLIKIQYQYIIWYYFDRYGKSTIIIIYHDFLPTPRRGSHVKSGKTHTQSSRYTP